MRIFAATLFTMALMAISQILGVSFDGHYERGLFYMVAWLVGYQLSEKLDK